MTEENFNELFSRNLRHYLSLNDKTQADLCKYLGVSSAVVSDWCNQKKVPRMDKIQAICNWLNIEKSDLLEDKNHNNDEKTVISENAQKLMAILKDLPEDALADILNYAEYQMHKNKSNP